MDREEVYLELEAYSSITIIILMEYLWIYYLVKGIEWAIGI